jgi:hypothetical protein
MRECPVDCVYAGRGREGRWQMPPTTSPVKILKIKNAC